MNEENVEFEGQESLTLRFSELVDKRRAARFLGVSPQLMLFWFKRGKGPPAINVGGRPFYRVAELRAWRANTPTFVTKTGLVKYRQSTVRSAPRQPDDSALDGVPSSGTRG
jgi:hypothetical protein